MKLLRYLEDITLYKSTEEKQPNGAVIKVFEEVARYKVQKRTLDDEVSATMYGANIDRMLDISTPLGDLEMYLKTKVDNKQDNISLYFISFNDSSRYKINSVKDERLIIERV